MGVRQSGYAADAELPIGEKAITSASVSRGLSWSLEENEDLARAWLYASEDAVYGINQKCAVFVVTMFENFALRGRGRGSSYAKWQAHLTRAHFQVHVVHVADGTRRQRGSPGKY